jgi:hypothetical protein
MVKADKQRRGESKGTEEYTRTREKQKASSQPAFKESRLLADTLPLEML